MAKLISFLLIFSYFFIQNDNATIKPFSTIYSRLGPNCVLNLDPNILF